MKKEKKRYFLVEYCGTKKVTYKTNQELEDALERIRKYNNRKTARFIIGNMSIDKSNDGYVLTSHLYNKLMPKSTISYIDNYTSQFDEKELISNLYDKLITANPNKNRYKDSLYPDINIAYFEDKNQNEKGEDDLIRQIRYIPVLYKNDRKYLNTKYVAECIATHANREIGIDYDFFNELLKEFTKFRVADNELDNLVRTINKVRYEGYYYKDLYYCAMNLYKKLIFEREKDGSLIRDENGSYQVSQRRLRDFGFFIKNYHSNIHKKATSYTYQDSKTKLAEMRALREMLLKEKEKSLKLK